MLGQGNLGFLPDSQTLVVFWGGTVFLLLDVETGQIKTVLSFHPQEYLAFMALRQSAQILGDFVIAPDGSGLAFATFMGQIWYWDFAGEIQRLIRDNPSDMPPGDASMPRFFPKGRTLTYWDRSDDMLHFVQVPTGLEFAALPIEGGQSRTFAFAPDGETFAWAGRDTVFVGRLTIDTREFAITAQYPITVPEELSGGIQQLAFTPDSRQIIVGGFRADDPADNRLYVIHLVD